MNELHSACKWGDIKKIEKYYLCEREMIILPKAVSKECR